MTSSPESPDAKSRVPAPLPTSRLARWSLILGLAGLAGTLSAAFVYLQWYVFLPSRAFSETLFLFLFCGSALCAFTAILTGGRARKHIRSSDLKLAGSDRAIAGQILGHVILPLFLLFSSYLLFSNLLGGLR